MNIFVEKYYSPDNFWVKMLFFISGITVTGLLTFANNSVISEKSLYFGSCIVAVILWAYITFKFKLLNKIWISVHLPCTVVSIIYTAVSTILFVHYFIMGSGEKIICYFINLIGSNILNLNSYVIVIILSIVLGCISIFSLYIIWRYLAYLVLTGLRKFIKSLDSIEKIYLNWIISLAILIIPIIYSLTSIFYFPTDITGTFHTYNSIFHMDTGYQMKMHMYTNIASPANDLYQCLFGLFSLPFGILAVICSNLFFFVPNSFYISISIIQICCLATSGILLSRLTKLANTQKTLFLLTYSISNSSSSLQLGHAMEPSSSIPTSRRIESPHVGQTTS